MANILQKASIDLILPQVPASSINELQNIFSSRDKFYFDEICLGYVYIKYPSISTQTSFFSQLEMRINTSFEVVKGSNDKTPWYSPEGNSAFWNGSAVSSEENIFDVDTNIKDKSIAPIFVAPDICVIPVDVSFGSFEDSKGLNETEVTLSLMWKPYLNEKALDEVVFHPDLPVMIQREASLNVALETNSQPVEFIKTLPKSTPLLTLPLRRTIKKTYQIQPIFSAVLKGTDSSFDEEDNFYIKLELFNRIEATITVEDVKLSLSGTVSRLFSGPSGTEPLFALPHHLNSSEAFSYLFKLTMFDMISNDGESCTKLPIAQKFIPFTGEPIHILVSCRFLYPNGTKSRQICTNCLYKPGTVVQNGDQRTPDSGIAVSFIVMDDAVTLHEIFKVKVVLANLTSETVNLSLIIPNTSTRASYNEKALTKKTKSLNISVEPEQFMKRYEAECVSGPYFICMENHVDVNNLKPKKSFSETLHFLPQRGAGTIQRLGCIKIINNETGQVSIIQNPIEVYIQESAE